MAVATQDDHDSYPRCAQFHAAAAIAMGALAIIRLMFDMVGSVTSRISHTTIDSRNAHQQSLWWSQVLSMREDPEDPNEPGHEECMIFSTDGRTRLLFIEVPEGKEVKNRIHFDLRPIDATREEEVARLIGLGATEVADHRRSDGSGWVTLADPEGNEFCVLRGDSQAEDPHAHLVA